MKKFKKWVAALCTSVLLAGVAAVGISTAANADGHETVLPANGVTSLAWANGQWTITLVSADASEVKLIDPAPQSIACSEHEGQPKNGHPLCDQTSYSFTSDAECVMVQVDWTDNIYNSSDPVACRTTETPEKVYVCKYVGTPGVDETLQTGNNPIEVSVNAIPGWDGTTIPFPFTDAQGNSVVIAFSDGPGSGQGDEPDRSDCPTPDPEPEVVVPDVDYVTAAWLVPGGPGSIWEPDQTLVTSMETDEPSLGALDSYPFAECSYYQIDVYVDNEITDELLDGGILRNPNDPPESLIPGGEGTAWKFVQTDCPIVYPPVVTPGAPVPVGPTCDVDGSYAFAAGYTPAVNDFKADPKPGEVQQVQRGYRDPAGFDMYVRNTTGLFGEPGDYVWQAYGHGANGVPGFPLGTSVGGKVDGNGNPKAGGMVSGSFTVLPATGFQSVDSEAPCFVAPERPMVKPTVKVNETVSCESDVVNITTTTTTPTFKYVEADHEWVEGEPTVEVVKSTRPLTDAEQDDCPLPPALALTGTNGELLMGLGGATALLILLGTALAVGARRKASAE